MTTPTLHLLAMPHVQATLDYVSDAYGMKLRTLAIMMSKKGYTVNVYGSEDYDFTVTGELIPCITKQKQFELFGEDDHDKHFYKITWNPNDECWQHFNTNAIAEIMKRYKPGDIIGTFSGVCQQQITEAFPDCFGVELGIGYTGVYADYRVFESYAHMHYVHGLQQDDNGKFYDTVIPGYHDKKKFPFTERSDYYLYIGRLIDRKGYKIAQEVCEQLGKKLVIAGQKDPQQPFTGYGKYIGTVDEQTRGQLMSHAIAVFTPTLYLGPFENTHVEAQLCGTPVITTNFGVYTETVQNGFNGQRCDDYQQFLNAVQWAESLNNRHRKKIRRHAQQHWSTDVVAEQYDEYFKRLMRLKASGWYQEYN